MYLNIHIVMEMALLKGPLRMHMMIENKTPPKMTRTGRGMLCHCICLLQSGTWEREKVETQHQAGVSVTHYWNYTNMLLF